MMAEDNDVFNWLIKLWFIDDEKMWARKICPWILMPINCWFGGKMIVGDIQRATD